MKEKQGSNKTILSWACMAGPIQPLPRQSWQGFSLFYFVDEEKGKREASYLS